MPKQTQPYEKSSKLRPHEIVFNNFIGGISWGLGATVGVALVFALLSLIAQNINFVPIIGSFVSDIINFILATNPHLQK
jgi:hypothetical protein